MRLSTRVGSAWILLAAVLLSLCLKVQCAQQQPTPDHGGTQNGEDTTPKAQTAHNVLLFILLGCAHTLWPLSGALPCGMASRQPPRHSMCMEAGPI